MDAVVARGAAAAADVAVADGRRRRRRRVGGGDVVLVENDAALDAGVRAHGTDDDGHAMLHPVLSAVPSDTRRLIIASIKAKDI